MRKHSALVILVLSVLAACGGTTPSINTGSTASSGTGATTSGNSSVQQAESDFQLLESSISEIASSAGLTIEKRSLEVPSAKCSATGDGPELGHRADITIRLRGAAGQSIEQTLAALVPGLKQADQAHFNGDGSAVVDKSSDKSQYVALRPDGFEIMVSNTGTPQSYVVDAHGPCHP